MQTQQKNEDTPIKKEKQWLKYLLILVAITLVASIFANSFLQPEAPMQNNTWKVATPGYKLSKKLQDQLGDPLEVKSTGTGKEYNYKSAFPIHNNTVTTDSNDVVQFIEEFILYDETHTLLRYTTKYGEPNLILNAPKIGDIVVANVFLDQGLVVFTHKYTNTVTQKWYFKPTTREIFLTTIGKDLTIEEIREPESFQ